MINFNPASLLVLNGILALMMFGVSLTLSLDDFRRVLRAPLAPVVGLVGSLQAVEAIKVIAAMGQPLVGRLLIIDVLNMQFRSVKVKRNAGCPVCSG